MQRIKSVDVLRGFSIWIMIYGHMLQFWIRPEDYWLKFWLYAFLAPIGATGFLFISGVSATLAYRSNLQTQKMKLTTMRNIFLLRAIFILIIALFFNLGVVLVFGGDLADIWSWNALQTIGISLLLAWPLLKTSKRVRLIVASSAIIFNQILLITLTPYNGQFNVLGVAYHILFNPIDTYVVLNYYGILLIGSLMGDYIYDLKNSSELYKKEFLFKNKAVIYSLLIGISITIFGISFFYPNFIQFNSISSVFYALGLIISFLAVLVVIEILEVIKPKKSYRFLYFYSYYSFTLFLGHNILLILFIDQLNAYLTIWIVVAAFNVILILTLKVIHDKLGIRASVKAGISILSGLIALKIEKKNG
ncbi:MAG: heparan-alpha-glucosaminide N-acetyltransferase domain-containing protein [Candidatus Lokiarchaeia archaeon]|nr:heparan-alpha-glucosaminide N-acetyltransferase domain-containing protein [Candidatus Lokiarchaeia archaeon]